MQKRIIEEVRELNLPLGEYAVISGGVLAIHGMRGHSDVDILVTPELFKLLRKSGWAERRITKTCTVLVYENFEATSKTLDFEGYESNAQKIIKDADIIKGIPFATLLETRKFKKAYGRDKDLEDIAMIDKYLSYRNLKSGIECL